MICAVITIILAIISFFHPWFFIPTIVLMVLCVAEFIVESITSDLLSSPAVGVGAGILGVAALILTVISLIVSLKALNGGDGGNNLLTVLETFNSLVY